MKSSRFHGTNPSQSRRLTGAKATGAIPSTELCDCFATRPKGARARNDVCGFTLVELLLGLIIFAVISTALYNMLYNGMKLDGKSQYIHKTYNEASMAFEALSRELPNALNYDFSGSYPDQATFVGKDNEMTFVLRTSQGIFAVRYYAGRPDFGKVSKTILAGVVKNLKSTVRSQEEIPVDFLMRRQMALPDFLSPGQGGGQEIISAGLKKGGLAFAYALRAKKESGEGTELSWQSEWRQPSLPAGVRVTLTLFDPDHPDGGVTLTREIYLPQGNAQGNAQQ